MGLKTSKRTVKHDAPIPAGDPPQHELKGSLHRIIADGITGQWYTYQQVAVLKTPNGTYNAATDYYHGSLPTNQVFTTNVL